MLGFRQSVQFVDATYCHRDKIELNNRQKARREMKNFPIRFLFLITILIAARIGGVFFYDSRLSKPQELPDPANDYTFAEYTAAKGGIGVI